MRKKVLVVTFDFPPGRTSAIYRVVNLARYLRHYDWQPTVLTVESGEGEVKDPELLRKLPAEVRVVRTPYLRLESCEAGVWKAIRTAGGLTSCANESRQPLLDRCLRSMGGFIRSLLYFPDFSVGWVPFGTVMGARLHNREQFDAIFTTEPPRSGSVIGLLLKLWLGVPWVLEFTDPWYCPKGALRRTFERWLQGLMVRCADAVVVMTEGHAKELQQRFGIAAEKLVVIPNGFDEEDFCCIDDGLRKELLASGYFHLTHLGTVYPNFSGNFFPALAQLLKERSDLKDRVRVNVVGYPDEITRRYAEEDGLRGVVRLYGFVPHAEAVRLMHASQGLLVFLADRNFCRLAISSKTYEYLRAGHPILAVAYPGGLQELLERAQAGWVVAPEDTEGIKQVVAKLVDDFQNRRPLPIARPEYTAQFRWDRLAGQLSSILDGVARHGC